MFGRRLKELRRKSGLTQAELGRKIGVSPSAVGMYEQGKREPDNHTLLKVCELFDTTTDYLINDDLKCSVYFNPAEEHELNDVISCFTNALLKQNNIVHKGQRFDQESIKNIVSSINMAVAYYLNTQGYIKYDNNK